VENVPVPRGSERDYWRGGGTGTTKGTDYNRGKLACHAARVASLQWKRKASEEQGGGFFICVHWGGEFEKFLKQKGRVGGKKR